MIKIIFRIDSISVILPLNNWAHQKLLYGCIWKNVHNELFEICTLTMVLLFIFHCADDLFDEQYCFITLTVYNVIFKQTSIVTLKIYFWYFITCVNLNFLFVSNEPKNFIINVVVKNRIVKDLGTCACSFFAFCS